MILANATNVFVVHKFIVVFYMLFISLFLHTKVKLKTSPCIYLPYSNTECSVVLRPLTISLRVELFLYNLPFKRRNYIKERIRILSQFQILFIIFKRNSADE